ncbi:hypothetical protein KIN20_035476 [Parelaphostrongylus tenuis]|uniref:TspO/MBR family protein n=1 Tax=Parelaphostrongylus tenuis TaxID=148309 RepID=A0AAD5RBJ8_PARTN|nr:hypothetical protein KIN20_035476 [Parelaphostrongylus tenuis]
MQNWKEYVAKDRTLIWTSEDTRNAFLSTLIPTGVALAGYSAFANDRQFVDWWTVFVKTPKWAPKDLCFYSAMDVLTLSPLGYASYLVYKYGGGFEYTDTRVALGLYGTSLALYLTTIPVVKNKDLTSLWKTSALMHLTALGAAYMFYKIDSEAGFWTIPYALWTGFSAYLAYSIDRENKLIRDM